jgi:hypothetical protein
MLDTFADFNHPFGQFLLRLPLNSYQTPITSTVFFDNFKDNRPSDLVPLQFPQRSPTISLTTTIEGGQYVVDAKRTGGSQQMYATDVEVQDFDLIVDVASIRGTDGFFTINFRLNKDKWGSSTNYAFQLSTNSKIATYYRVYSHMYTDNDSNLSYKTIKEASTNILTPLNQVRVKCKQETCEFFINDQKVYSDNGFRKVAGDIDFWIDGEFTIRLNSITVNHAN